MLLESSSLLVVVQHPWVPSLTAPLVCGMHRSAMFTDDRVRWVCRYNKDIADQFSLGRVLGKGQFGTTRIAIQRATGEQFACKTISKRKIVRKQVRVPVLPATCSMQFTVGPCHHVPAHVA